MRPFNLRHRSVICSCPPQIAKDAKECVQECVSEFISFITSEASERCHQEKRKTINGEDILFAMSTLGFDMYVEPLKLYLQKFREVRQNDHVKWPHRHGIVWHHFVILNALSSDSNLSVMFIYLSGYLFAGLSRFDEVLPDWFQSNNRSEVNQFDQFWAKILILPSCMIRECSLMLGTLAHPQLFLPAMCFKKHVS